VGTWRRHAEAVVIGAGEGGTGVVRVPRRSLAAISVRRLVEGVAAILLSDLDSAPRHYQMLQRG
jgi:hypothetical protein